VPSHVDGDCREAVLRGRSPEAQELTAPGGLDAAGERLAWRARVALRTCGRRRAGGDLEAHNDRLILDEAIKDACRRPHDYGTGGLVLELFERPKSERPVARLWARLDHLDDVHVQLITPEGRPVAGEPASSVFGVTPSYVRTRLGRAIRDACDDLELERFTPHGLRRAAVDAFQRAGVDVGSAAAYLGHSPQVMLEKYRTASLDDKRRAEQATQLGAGLHLLAVVP
jgi:integrase